MSTIREVVVLSPMSSSTAGPSTTAGHHGYQPHLQLQPPSYRHQRYPYTAGYPMSADMIQIANFRPTSRQVISGIAPHVFDERKRRRSQKRVQRPPYWYGQCEKPSSPLRGATVMTWDEHSIYLEQQDSQLQHAAELETALPRSGSVTPDSEEEEHDTTTQRSVNVKRRSSPGWKRLRVDKQLFKVLRLKFTLSSSKSSS